MTKLEDKYQETLKKENELIGMRKGILRTIDDYCLLKEDEYTNVDAIYQYGTLIRLGKSYIDKEKITRYCKEKYIEIPQEVQYVLDKMEEVEKEYGRLKKGIEGETKVRESVNLFSDKVKIIQNSHFIFDDIDVEVDLLIISKKGVFCIEVKNWRDDAVLDEKGFLRRKRNNEEEKDGKNIVGQMKRHKHCLRRMLEKGLGKEVPVYSVFLWQNNSSKLEVKFSDITVCYTNTLEDEIFNNDHEDMLNEEQLIVLENFLNFNRKSERKYKLVVDKTFFKTFKDVATFIYDTELDIVRKEADKLSYKINEKEKHPGKYYTKKVVGNTVKGIGVTLVAIATVLAVTKDD